MSISTVLIVSADAEFATRLMAGWQSQPAAFVTLGESCTPDVISACDVAVCGPAPSIPSCATPAHAGNHGPSDSLVAILRSLHAAGRPVICLASDLAAVSTLRQAHPRAIILPEQEGWFDNLIAIGAELIRGADASARVRRAEAALAQAELQASLGRFLLGMRHSLNNALTSILGNAELLLLEPEKLAPEIRDQIATVHEMSLRIHDIMLQFTALEQEAKIAATAQRDIPIPPRPMLHSAVPRTDLHDGLAAHGSGLS